MSDKKIGIDQNTDGTIDYYTADVITANDYYPFGSLMPGRNYNAPGAKDARYGFNGKENDNEVKGEGNQQDYGFRIYDPRLGRFLSVDPLSPEYPFYTPYQFAGNSPISNIDLDGLEDSLATEAKTNFAPVISPASQNVIKQLAQKAAQESARAGGQVAAEAVKETAGKSVLRFFAKGGTLFITFMLSSLDAGQGSSRDWSKNPLVVDQPAPATQPQPDPRTVAPPKKEGEDGAHLYKTVDNQKNSGKGGLGYVANKMSDPIPYVGITVNPIIGGQSRYLATSLRGLNSEIIGTDKFTTVAGAETAVIALNTYGVNYKSHLGNLVDKDARGGTRIANLRFTYKNTTWIAAGIRWLNQTRPGWDKPGSTNSLLYKENKKGANNPTP